MTIQITINMDNAAFDDGNEGGTELARILHRLATRAETDGGNCDGVNLYDANGNRVGHVKEIE